MILTETNGGTRLSSTRYVHYGTITARGMYSAHDICVAFPDPTVYVCSKDRSMGWCGHCLHYDE
jgi:hypothetical protein